MEMYAGGTPPMMNEAGDAQPKTVARWRWWLHLGVLTLFPLLYGVLGFLHHDTKRAMLPKDVRGLLILTVFELVAFAVLFTIAWSASRVDAAQLLLRWRGKGMPALLGFAYSFALRGVIMVLLAMVMAGGWVLTGFDSKKLEQLRPHTQNVINTEALLHSPLYLVLCLTLISFVVAALREELWRAGMLAGINALFPRQFAHWRGKAVAVLVVPLLFGLGHTIQGLSGVAVTAVLGLGLGAIMVAHRSIWEAVVAHGFFDASTFALLYIVVKYFPGMVPGL